MANYLFDGLFGEHESNQDTFLKLLDGTDVTYAAFLDKAARFAAVLGDAGLVAGDLLAAQVAKSPDGLALYAACLRSGIVYVPLNTGYTASELDYFLSHSGAKMLICNTVDRANLQPLADQLSIRLEAIDDVSGEFCLSLHNQVVPPQVAVRDKDDIAAILYTSGTTGRSKGAMLTGGNLLSNARALARLWAFGADDVLLHALPIFHTHGLFVATNVTVVSGSAMIFLPRFDTEQMIQSLPDATCMMGVPTFYSRLLDNPLLQRPLVAHMRLFISGSAPLSNDTFARFESRTGHQILERYGMTETNMIASNPYDGDRKPGTVGVPLPGIEVRLSGAPKDGPPKPNHIGGIEVKGANVFAGYWKDPEKTRDEFSDDGFFLTGDLGCLDADGYLQIVGRNKDLIISGGYNIYPKEVETVLDGHPQVAESAVFGIPHKDMGETVVAVIVPRRDTTVDPKAILHDTAKSLARYKVPRKIFLNTQLPRNVMGKVLKAELRKTYTALEGGQ